MFNFFKKGQEKKFKFFESENTACFVCCHILNREIPILSAFHYEEDGAWQFMCGLGEHDDSHLKIISLKQAVDIDESINDLYEMPLGVGAERENVNSAWYPFKLAGIKS